MKKLQWQQSLRPLAVLELQRTDDLQHQIRRFQEPVVGYVKSDDASLGNQYEQMVEMV
jgi:hypothetical protein